MSQHQPESNPATDSENGEKIMKRVEKVYALAVLAGVLAITSATSAAAQHRSPEHDRELQGSWTAQVQTVDCTSGKPLGSPFLSFLSFALGGTLTETTSNPNFYPAQRSPGHGVWSENDDGYRAVSSAFITLNGALQTTQVITQAIQMNGGRDSFSSVATVEFFDPNGHLVKSGCAIATGTRMQ